MTVTQQIAEGARRLAAGRDPATARLDAELLAAHLAGISRDRLLLDPPPPLDQTAYDALIARRAAAEPLAQIVGETEFWSLPIRVTRDVLTPRSDSEALIELALELRGGRSTRTIIDYGTGSGCLLLAGLTEFPAAEGLGIDRSAAAIRVASENAALLGVEGRAAFLIGDWAALEAGKFDLLLCNPPYIEENAELGPGVRDYEPAGALFAGTDGLAAYRVVLPLLRRHLAPDGHAVVEIGAGQQADVTQLAVRTGLKPVGARRDLGGHVRALGFTIR